MKNWQSPYFFQENSILPIFGEKGSPNGSKIGFFRFFEKNCRQFFLEVTEMKNNIVIDFLSPIPYQAKSWFSSSGPKCYWAMKSHDSWTCNISRKKWMMKFIFWHADKHWSILQLGTIILGLRSQACPKYPK